MPGVKTSGIRRLTLLVEQPCFHDIYLPFTTTNLHLHIHFPVVAGGGHRAGGPGWFLYDEMIFFAYFLNITELYRLGDLRSCIMISDEGHASRNENTKIPNSHCLVVLLHHMRFSGGAFCCVAMVDKTTNQNAFSRIRSHYNPPKGS